MTIYLADEKKTRSSYSLLWKWLN